MNDKEELKKIGNGIGVGGGSDKKGKEKGLFIFGKVIEMHVMGLRYFVSVCMCVCFYFINNI